MAAGTRTQSDVAILIDLEKIDEKIDLEDGEVTGLDALIASTVFRTTGSRSASTIAVQLRRNCRNRQSPPARRTSATLAPTAHARKTKTAQRPGMVIAGRAAPHQFPHA
jgi:hypothetical protein